MRNLQLYTATTFANCILYFYSRKRGHVSGFNRNDVQADARRASRAERDCRRVLRLQSPPAAALCPHYAYQLRSHGDRCARVHLTSLTSGAAEHRRLAPRRCLM